MKRHPEMGTRLRIELVPKPLWEKSLRKLLPRSEWDELRREELVRAGGKCEVCSYQGRGLICHEVWEYDDKRHVATVLGFQIVCSACDMVHHMGRAGAYGSGEEAVRHFMNVNHLSKAVAVEEVRRAFAVWQERSRHEWTIDWGMWKEKLSGKAQSSTNRGTKDG